MTIEYPGELNAIIYSLFSAPGLSREGAAALVRTMYRGEYFPSSPAAYLTAIKQALSQDEPVTRQLEPPYKEAEVREFLRLMQDELEKAESDAKRGADMATAAKRD